MKVIIMKMIMKAILIIMAKTRKRKMKAMIMTNHPTMIMTIKMVKKLVKKKRTTTKILIRKMIITTTKKKRKSKNRQRQGHSSGHVHMQTKVNHLIVLEKITMI
jgi:hypothetical protein